MRTKLAPWVRNSSGTSLFTQTVRFGADGAFDANNDGVADQESKTFALSVNGLDPASGLTDVLTGQAIVLVRNATTGVVEGHVGVAAGALAFTISAGVFTGNITLTQLRAVTHDDPNDPDESTSPAVLNADLVRLTMTVKDGDADTASPTPSTSVRCSSSRTTRRGSRHCLTLTPLLRASKARASEQCGQPDGQRNLRVRHRRDSHPAAFYDATHSDFVDANDALQECRSG